MIRQISTHMPLARHDILRTLRIVQNSVFEANLDYSTFLKLKDRLLRLIDQEQDSLRFYYLGNNWERRVEHIGAKKTYNPEGVIII